MQTDLGKIREIKQLAEAQELGTKLSKLSEILGVFSESLQKSGINLESIEDVKEEVTKHQEANDFLVEVCKYVEKQVTNSAKEVEELYDQIRQKLQRI